MSRNYVLEKNLKVPTFSGKSLRFGLLDDFTNARPAHVTGKFFE
jgi:hypothetical protein